MKQLVIAVAVLLSGSAVLSGVSSCSSDNDGEKADSTRKEVKGEQKGEAFAAATNIRYVDLDSLMSNYEYAKDQSKVVEQIAIELQAYQNQLGTRLQAKQAEMQKKMNANAYTEETYKQDMAALQSMDQNSQAQYAKRAEADNARVNEINKSVKDAIDSFIVEYNASHKYDAILLKEAGLYFNPSLDITGEVVKGLNEAYSKKKSGTAKTEEKK